MKKLFNFLKSWFLSIKNFSKAAVIMFSLYGFLNIVQTIVERHNPETPIVGLIGYAVICLAMVALFGWQEGWHLELRDKITEAEQKLKDLKDKFEDKV